MNYSMQIEIGADGMPRIKSFGGYFPPAGHLILITGQYELPTVRTDAEGILGTIAMSAQQFDSAGDHVISAMQHHDRALQGPNASDIKIIDQLRRQAQAIRDAELIKADPEAPLPEVGPERASDGAPKLKNSL